MCVCAALLLIPMGVANAMTKGKRMGTRLESGKTGITLKSGIYYVDSDVTITAKTGPAIDIADGAEVYIYIDKGCTLTCVGGDGVCVESKVNGEWTWKKTAAGAGIHLPEGTSLTLMGEGTVDAKGGAGYARTAGHDAEEGSYHWESNADKSWVKSGRGGAGGTGEGSAGAGIGGNGANGGDGGAPAAAVTLTGGFKEKVVGVAYGNKGKSGESGEGMGSLAVWNSVVVKAKSGGTKTKTDIVAKGAATVKMSSYKKYDGSSSQFLLVSAGSGAGGAGGYAESTQSIGSSGNGGVGGYSGPRGAIANIKKTGTKKILWVKVSFSWFSVGKSGGDSSSDYSGSTATLVDSDGDYYTDMGDHIGISVPVVKWPQTIQANKNANIQSGNVLQDPVYKINVNIFKDGEADTEWAMNRTVTLCTKSGDNYAQVCEMLNTGALDGTYTSTYYYELPGSTGDTYYVFVDGKNTGQTFVIPDEDVSVDVNAYTMTVNVTSNMSPLRNAVVQFYDKGDLAYTFTEAGAGVYEAVVIDRPDGSNTYEIYLDGESTQKQHTFSKTSASCSVNIYDIKVYVTEDGVNKQGVPVTLRRGEKDGYTLSEQPDGSYAYRLIADSGAAEATGTYDIYVYGEDSGKDIDFSSEAKLSVEIPYITLSVTVNRDGAPWTDTDVTLTDSKGQKTTLSHSGGGVYKAVLQADTYNIEVAGVDSSSGSPDIVSSSHRSATLDFYTVTYHRNFDELFTSDQDIYLSCVLRSGSSLIVPSKPSAGGANFRYWADTKDGAAGYDFTQTISGTLNLYAIWDEPSIVIGSAVRCDAGGNVNGSGMYYMMKNLTISGISSDFKIKNIQLDYTNTANINIPAGSYEKNVTKGTNTAKVTTDRTVLTFSTAISVSEAQTLLQSIIVQPTANAAHTMQVTIYTEAAE